MENIGEWVDKLKKSKKSIIVEGIKDKKALEHFGIKKIITLKGKPIYKVIEDFSEKEVIILTDLDKEGKKLYSKLKQGLTQRGVEVDNKFREFLFKTKLRQIEGLPRYSTIEIRQVLSHTFQSFNPFC